MPLQTEECVYPQLLLWVKEQVHPKPLWAARCFPHQPTRIAVAKKLPLTMEVEVAQVLPLNRETDIPKELPLNMEIEVAKELPLNMEMEVAREFFLNMEVEVIMEPRRGDKRSEEATQLHNTALPYSIVHCRVP